MIPDPSHRLVVRSWSRMLPRLQASSCCRILRKQAPEKKLGRPEKALRSRAKVGGSLSPAQLEAIRIEPAKIAGGQKTPATSRSSVPQLSPVQNCCPATAHSHFSVSESPMSRAFVAP